MLPRRQCEGSGVAESDFLSAAPACMFLVNLTIRSSHSALDLTVRPPSAGAGVTRVIFWGSTVTQEPGGVNRAG